MTVDIVTVVALTWFVCGIASALISRRRGLLRPGHEEYGYFILGVVLGPLGVALTLIEKPPRDRPVR